ncbi:xylose isomerase-like protein [Aspergillus pseudoustus]|uniref:Xylose isomerase-like protein n=1 Tax=Aspergillus pseudoustus TaxID=1810923 RepID=A0ABR4J6H7_9EURO
MFQPAIASPSVGHQTVHSITARLEAIASQGFKLVELVEDDIVFFARDHLGGVTSATKRLAATKIKLLCDTLHLKPFVLQPFWFYEGLEDPMEHAALISKLREWIELARILDIQMIQIPTNWRTEGITGDLEAIVRDLTEMAEIGLEQDPPISFAYEGVAWGTYIDTWQGTWEVVKRVNRSNFGLCLDTYHIVARVWGDPTRPGCKSPDGDQDLRKSMEELVSEVDVNKIFYVQLSDAELLDQPLFKGHPFYREDQKPRMAWSRNARLFPWEQNQRGCLPLEPVVGAIFNALDFRGIVSVETFSKDLLDDSLDVPSQFAARGMHAWNAAMQNIQGNGIN